MNKQKNHEAFGRFLCTLLGKDPFDWKSIEAGPVPITNSQEVHPLSPPSNKIYFTELRIIK